MEELNRLTKKINNVFQQGDRFVWHVEPNAAHMGRYIMYDTVNEKNVLGAMTISKLGDLMSAFLRGAKLTGEQL